jgi:uncharacterized GH25 family protein
VIIAVKVSFKTTGKPVKSAKVSVEFERITCTEYTDSRGNAHSD